METTIDLTEVCHEVEKAIETLAKTRVKRLDGEGWKAYRVGDVVRIDISLPKEQQ